MNERVPAGVDAGRMPRPLGPRGDGPLPLPEPAFVVIPPWPPWNGQAVRVHPLTLEPLDQDAAT